MLRLVWSKDSELARPAMDRTVSYLLPEDALEIGYLIGCNIRHAGADKAYEDRELGSWAGDNPDRPNFVFWLFGFCAGLRGAPKPKLRLLKICSESASAAAAIGE